MIKLYPVLFSLIIFCGISSAISKDNNDQSKSDVYIFVNSAQVRNSPSADVGNVIDNLSIGQKVSIIQKKDTTYALNGIENFWYEISYTVNNSAKKGYVWGGLLSFDYILYGDNTVILIGLTSYKKNAGYNLSLKVVSGQKLLSNAPFVLFSKQPQRINDLSTLKVDFYDNLGLVNFDNILKISLNSVSDGGKQNKVIAGIVNNRAVYIAEERYQNRADVARFHGSYIFPKEEGGQSGCVIYKYVEYAPGNDTKENVILRNEKKIYVWDADSSSLISK
ncbi:MAG TPA: hypothetical protein VF857_08295 [Spirochaetota bacterium]